MPFTVITLKKVPNSLRGDLTRWMQEIATGVYVGSYNSKVREYLWKRVTDTVGQGEASMCYSCRNEIGYSFCTCNTNRLVIDYDGIPLVLLPVKESDGEATEKKQEGNIHGFSLASTFHQAKRKLTVKPVSDVSANINSRINSVVPIVSDKYKHPDIAFLDLETTGLDPDIDQIIEIGVIKVLDGKVKEFHRLIQNDIHVPDVVRRLTGITDEMLRKGMPLEICCQDLNIFIQDTILAGYNLSFDIKFLNKAFEKCSLEPIHNKTLELMKEAKKRNSFQDNFKFETTLKEYGINQKVLHRALEDAKLMHLLYNRMMTENH